MVGKARKAMEWNSMVLTIDSPVTYGENPRSEKLGPSVDIFEISNQLGTWLGGGVAAALAAAFAFQKARAMWESNSATIDKAKGEGDIVSLLRTELERMAAQNDKLANLVNKLQSQVFELSSKNARLQRQIEMMDFDLKSMRGPVGLNEEPEQEGGK